MASHLLWFRLPKGRVWHVAASGARLHSISVGPDGFPIGAVLCGSIDCHHSCDQDNKHECSTACPCAAEDLAGAEQ